MSKHATQAKTARTMSTRTKVLASTALLAAAAGAAGLGTFGSFTSTTSASEAVTSGTVVVGLGATGTADNRLSVAANGVVPGDTITRAVKLSNTGNQNFGGVTLTTTAGTSSKLDVDATNGLQLQIDKCSTAWSEAGNGTTTPYTYSCSGTTTNVLASRAIIGSNLTLNNLASLTAGNSDNLLVTITLPTSADNTFQGLTSTINFAFTATQRAAANR
jgi:spore coat-associated protein N